MQVVVFSKMLSDLKNSRYMQYACAISATLASMSTAPYLTWPSPSLPKLTSENSPLGQPITIEEASWVVSALFLPSLPAALLSGWMIERFGRKTTLLASSMLILFPWVMIMFAKSVVVLFIARFLAGLGSGIITVGIAIYAGEIAENDIRGRLGTFFVLLKLLGSLIVLSAGPFVSYLWLAIICGILPVIFFCTFVFMPESPYYLMKIGDIEGAKKTLVKLSSKMADDEFIDKKLMEIETTVENDMKNNTTVWEFLSKKEYRMSIFVMTGVKILQQFNGLNAIDAYMQTIIGLTESKISPEISSIIFGAIQVPAALIASVLVDKVGRKPLLIVSALGCATALIGEGCYFYIQDVVKGDTSSIDWLPTTGISLFLLMTPVGIVTLPYVLLGEFFPTNIKGIAVSVATFFGSTLGFFVSKFFMPLSESWGSHTLFWFFSGVCICGAIFVGVFLPETKGKTFSEIQDLLNKRNQNCEKYNM